MTVMRKILTKLRRRIIRHAKRPHEAMTPMDRMNGANLRKDQIEHRTDDLNNTSSSDQDKTATSSPQTCRRDVFGEESTKAPGVEARNGHQDKPTCLSSNKVRKEPEIRQNDERLNGLQGEFQSDAPAIAEDSLTDAVRVPKPDPNTVSKDSVPDQEEDALDQGYKYEELDRERQEIRILIVEPNDNEDSPINVRLEPLYLTDPGAPKYEALSYEWGQPPKYTKYVLIRGKPWTVTESLFFALKRLRRSDADRALWADALCINQDDDEEKSYQIPLMKEVYTKAENVVSWLGEPSPQVEAWISGINAFLDYLTQFTVEKDDAEMDWILEFESFDELKAKIAPVFRGIWHIYGLSYWQRIWIVQEYVLSRKHSLITYGKFTISPDIFPLQVAIFRAGGVETVFGSLAVELVRTEGKVINVPRETVPQCNWVRVVYRSCLRDGQVRFGVPISSILRQTCGLQCTRPADFVYGIYGMISHGRTLPQPDYSKDLQQLSWEIICQALKTDPGRLDWSLFASYEPFARGVASSLYPSWALDLFHSAGKFPTRHSLFIRTLFPFRRYASIVQKRRPWTLTNSDRHLSSYGAEIGHIRSVLRIDTSRSAEEICQDIREFSFDRLIREDPWLGFLTVREALTTISKEDIENTRMTPWVFAVQHFASIISESPEPDKVLPSDMHPGWQELRQSPQYLAEALQYARQLHHEKFAEEWAWTFQRSCRENVHFKDRWSIFLDTIGNAGEAPVDVEPGDTLAILGGVRYPYVLRQVRNAPEELFEMIGLAHLEDPFESMPKRKFVIC